MRTTIALALLLSTATQAQHNWQWDICPDFTVTDINGNSHNLYSYLDQGYTVYLDIAATWCITCWEIHTSETLDSLYLLYGPGTPENKVMVLLIESDANTGLNELQGISGATQGDWITGTPYPIIDDASVISLLQCPGYGHVHAICPNRQVIGGWQYTTAQMWQDAQYCAMYTATTQNDATLSYIPDHGICDGSAPQINIRLQNTGTNTLSSAAIETTVHYHQDQTNATAVDTFFWSGALATYAYEELTVAQVPVDIGLHTAGIRLLDPDDKPQNDLIHQGLSSSAVAPGTTVNMEFLTDNDAEQTFWSLRRFPDAMVIDEVALGAYADNTTYQYTWQLDNNTCHYLLLQDMGGNGLADPAYVKLSVNGTVFADIQDFLFNADQIEFLTDVQAGVGEAPPPTTLLLAPNPMDEQTVLDLSGMEGRLLLRLMDAAGRLVRKETLMAGSTVVLARNGLAAGCYTVLVSGGGSAGRAQVVMR
ncbi:MAG: hypothetical protein IPJ76_16420 [Flavobacteriales bacterium]|nr:MAG: hypothetical protein IPJ76_16420 [Flavobacteriales bacterium]